MTNEQIKQDVVLRDKSHLLPDMAFPVGDLYGYEAALTATGVTLLAFEQFGSYQGEWYAKVKFPNGETYFVSDYFGSCSVCDAFEAQFGWNSDKDANYLHKLRDFGIDYIKNCMTFEQAVAKASEHSSWDFDADRIINWLNDNK